MVDKYPYFGPGVPGQIELINNRPRVLTSPDNGPGVDAFGRLRTADPFTLFDQSFNYHSGDLYWHSVLAGSGTSTHDYRTASIAMTVGTASGDSVIRQTKRYFDYQPGKSHFILMTFTLADPQTNLSQRVGYFDTSDGVFLQQTDDAISMVVRSSTTGSPDDNVIGQSSWNKDKLDGTGASGYTLDLTKSQILFIDMEWLGVGRVRTGFVINGEFIIAHEFYHSNVLDKVYMRTAHLPLRYEIINDGATSGATLNQICSTVISEGGHNLVDTIGSASNGVTTRTAGTIPLPVLAIRPGTAYPQGGTVPNRETLIPLSYEIFSEDSPILYQIIVGGTVAGGSWSAVDAINLGAEFNVTGTSISGGMVLESGYLGTGRTSGGIASNIVQTNLGLTLDYAGTAGTEWAIVIARVGSVSSDVCCSINFEEI